MSLVFRGKPQPSPTQRLNEVLEAVLVGAPALTAARAIQEAERIYLDGVGSLNQAVEAAKRIAFESRQGVGA